MLNLFYNLQSSRKENHKTGTGNRYDDIKNIKAETAAKISESYEWGDKAADKWTYNSKNDIA